MNIAELHISISQVFNPKYAVNHAPDDIDIHFVPFFSEYQRDNATNASLHLMRGEVAGGVNDESIIENQVFNYPIFMPASAGKNNGAILLLHGLNERRYDKYFTWAHRLVKLTGKAVILFPISFHLNRGLPNWTDRHLMAEKAAQRKVMFQNDEQVFTYINQALSERLTESPERFFLSGLQTSIDIVSLAHSIRSGNHPLFEKNAGVDLFAYSVGGLLAQVLFISNPDELFTDSKMFLFCAGAFFEDMNGISKVILDPPAYQRIHQYYTREFEANIKRSGVFADFFNNNKIGMAFRSVITSERFKSVRDRVFKTRSRQIFALSLNKDKVIPSDKIKKAVNRGSGKMEVLDFDYPYSHEIPFPIKQSNWIDKINEAFELVFFKAGVFLS